jgi:predicted 2-oxoglutarate/Fe(II)-dependent dioxygenase YbiX
MTTKLWFGHYIAEIEDFLPAQRCESLIALAEGIGFDEATINTSAGHVLDKQVRNNDRVISDDPMLAHELWNLARPHIPLTFKGREVVGLNERLRFYRYGPGQKFDWHQDGYFERANGERSQFTFMVYLNDGFEGGGTSFDDPYGRLGFCRFAVKPRKGSALLFYHHLDHRGDEVTWGRKYVLRTDVMFSRRTDR